MNWQDAMSHPVDSGTSRRKRAMSNIPSSAVAAAFIPVQRAANELLRARQVQSQKNSHHQEEVEELDDTAVDSVTDEQQSKGRERERKPRKRRDGEQVEIESLGDTAGQPTPVAKSKDSIDHLDISA